MKTSWSSERRVCVYI